MSTEKRFDTATFYIEPVLDVFDSLAETIQPDTYQRISLNRDAGQRENYRTVAGYACAFIIGEPGYGKSRFLKQMTEFVAENYRRVDCRTFADHNDVSNYDGLTHLFFDGLDEVPPVLFLYSLDRINHIIEDHAGLHVFIACRTHYLVHFKNRLEKFTTAKFVQLQAFQEIHIRRYLHHHLTDSNLIDAIVGRSAGNAGNGSVLKTPRYLEALVRSVLEEDLLPQEIMQMGRTDIFEKVIYFQLRSELEKVTPSLAIDGEPVNDQLKVLFRLIGDPDRLKHNVNELQITQRVLEKLAFTMEIYQRNQITDTELVTFLDELNSNISLIFLQYSSIDKFVERTLKKTGRMLEFEHTEFQEYLAAKELIRISDSAQVLYDLILEKDLQVIYSSWLDVLQYAIELDADKVAGSLVNYLKVNSGRQFDERLVSILMGPGIEKAGRETKAELFAVIFGHYQLSGRFLFQRNDDLSALYIPELNQRILSVPDMKTYGQNELRQLTNYALIISSLAKLDALDRILASEWKDHLLKILDIPELHGQYEVWLWTLEQLGAVSELRSLQGDMVKKDDVQLSVYLETIGRVAADEMLPFFIDVLTTRSDATGKEEFLGALRTEKGISDALEFIIRTPDIRSSLFNHDRRFIIFYKLFDRIRELNSEAIDKLVEEAVYVLTGEDDFTDYSGSAKAFIDEAIDHLLRKYEHFALRLVQRKNHADVFQESSEVITTAISLEQFDIIYGELQKDPWELQSVHRITGQLALNGSPERKTLLAAIQEKYPELFLLQATSPEREAKQRQLVTERLTKEYERLLMRGTDQINLQLLEYYQNNKTKLTDIAKAADVEKMTVILTDIIDTVSPERYRVRLDRNGNTVSYHVNHTDWYRFGYYLAMAFKFDLTEVLQRNRTKIIKFLPLFNEHLINGFNDLGSLLDFLGEITNPEVEMLLDFCANRKDDYILSSIPTFCKFISGNKLVVLKPVLLQMMNSEKPQLYEKEKILQAYGALSESPQDKIYLEAFVTEYDPSDQQKRSLGEIANEFLIAVFTDHSAIRWRFQALIDREEPHSEPATSSALLGPYPDWEQEYDRPSFTKCFDEISDPEVVKGMEKLLRHSLESRKKKDMNRYSSYLQLIVFEYFSRHCTLEIINMLRAVLVDKDYESTANSFKGYLRNLEVTYTNAYQVYRTISEPVKRFNELRASQYVPIADAKGLASVMDLALDDMKDFINNKGYRVTANQLSNTIVKGKTSLYNEDILQKTFKVQLENSLLRRGIRDTDIHRESELFDGKRLDIILRYGFIGPIMAELKLLKNPEITDDKQRANYKPKLMQYIAATNASYAYYIVFNTSGVNGSYRSAFNKLVTEYGDIPDLKIILIDCPI